MIFKAFMEKDASEPIDKTTNTDDNPTEDLRDDTALSQNSNASDDNGTTILSNTNSTEEKCRWEKVGAVTWLCGCQE